MDLWRETLLCASLGVAGIGGCASKPNVPAEADPLSISGAPMTSTPSAFNDPRYKQLLEQASHGPVSTTPPSTGVTGALKRAASSVSSALSMEPKVVQADDPVRLSSKPEKLSSDVYFRAARLYENEGQSAEAIESYKKALEIDPHNVMTLVSLARVYDRAGDISQASQWYQHAIDADPNSPLPHNDFGLCHARQGDLNGAIAELQKAVALDPQRKLYRNNLATVLVEANRLDDAVKQLAAVHPLAVAHYNVGFLLAQSGRRDDALKHLRSAMQLDPQLEPARTLMAQVADSAQPLRTGMRRVARTEAPQGSPPEPVTWPSRAQLERTPPTQPGQPGPAAGQFPVRTLSAIVEESDVKAHVEDQPTADETTTPQLTPLRQPLSLLPVTRPHE